MNTLKLMEQFPVRKVRPSRRERTNRREHKLAELAVFVYHAKLASKPAARRLRNRAVAELRRRNIAKKRAAGSKINPFGGTAGLGVGRGRGTGDYVLIPEAPATNE